MGLKFDMMKNSRQYIKIARASQDIDKHLFKRCAYCDLDMGSGYEFPVTDFIQHLIVHHSDKVEEKELQKYKKILKI